MILIALVSIPLAGAVLAWLVERRRASWTRYVSLGAVGLDLTLALALASTHAASGRWLSETRLSWIPRFRIEFHLAVDGLSLALVVLTLFLGLVAIASSWTEIRDRAGFFHFNLLVALTGLLGVFLAVDLLLFYFFWELMLVPMYFLIGIWGHENRVYAAIKFFLFTQAGGLLMLVSILTLSYLHAQTTGVWTFDYERLLGTELPRETAMWLLLGFCAAFAVKLPAVPLHTWLPDAHTEAPTAGSVLLAGVLLKTGGYGLLRFAVPLFPEAARSLAPWAMSLGVVGILYGALLAFSQTDLKRLVAYTSVSHLGFVLVGVFAGNELAQQGALVVMLAHGITTGALFVLAGMIQERTETRDLDRLGGLWSLAPRMGAVALVFAMASLGLPGLGNFVGEFLTLFGSYRASVPLTVLAAFGLVVATVYALELVQRVFHGPSRWRGSFPDLSPRETTVLAALLVAIVWLGLYPQPVLELAEPALAALREPPLAAMETR